MGTGHRNDKGELVTVRKLHPNSKWGWGNENWNLEGELGKEIPKGEAVTLGLRLQLVTDGPAGRERQENTYPDFAFLPPRELLLGLPIGRSQTEAREKVTPQYDPHRSPFGGRELG